MDWTEFDAREARRLSGNLDLKLAVNQVLQTILERIQSKAEQGLLFLKDPCGGMILNAEERYTIGALLKRRGFKVFNIKGEKISLISWEA